MLSFLNACIGPMHRFGLGETVVGPLDGDGLIVLACVAATFASTYIVYRSLFSLTFTWCAPNAVHCKRTMQHPYICWNMLLRIACLYRYMVLMFVEQMSHSLLIDSAMRVHLPCYCDIRHEGNLEGWFTGRRYFNQYCNTHVFSLKNQFKIATALVVCGVFSVQAVTNYFDDVENIDWSNPGGFVCLLNLLVLLGCLFLSLIALERINKCTIKLVRKLDHVSINVSRGVGQEAMERLERDEFQIDHKTELKMKERERQARVEEASVSISQKATGVDNGFAAGTQKLLKQQVGDLKDTLREINLHANDVVNRHDIGQEAHYLEAIIAELRDQAELRRIFGIVVDRAMLTNLFGGVLALLYLVFKSAIDLLLIKYAPPSPMKSVLASSDLFGDDANLGASGSGGD
eukprot:COSAG06_NODE_8426_length_2178_cov_8.941151_2_plen_403_part_00